MFCFDAAGKLLQVGRWKTFVSVLPMKYCVESEDSLEEDPPDVEPLEEPPDVDPLEEPPEDEPPEITPEPEPVVSVLPLGK